MSSSNQSPLESAKAQTPQLDRILQTEHDQPRTIAKEHETQIETLLRSFKERQQSIVLDAEKAFKASAEARDGLERKLQEEKQRVSELTAKLDKAKNNDTALELALERTRHVLTQNALDSSKSKLDRASRETAGLTKALKAAEKRISELWAEFHTLGERKDQVQAELELSKGESADIQNRLKAAEQRNVQLEADLKAATERAAGAEDGLEAFQSRFKRITDDMSALASSSKQQPNAAHSMSPTPAQGEKDSVEQTDSGPQPDDSPARPRDLDPQLSNTLSSKESDLLNCRGVLDQVMDAKNWHSNQYFLKAMDSLTLASRDAKLGPMNLGTMNEKLAKGAYDSSPAFKADFDLMITDARTMNPPHNPVRIAAEQLSRIFDQAHSSREIYGHEAREDGRSAQGLNVKKRKADTESLVSSGDGYGQKRRSLAPTKESTDPVQPAISGARASLTPALSVSSQSQNDTQGSEKLDADHVSGQITTGTRLKVAVTLPVVAQLVSFTRSPSTITGDWKSLLPDNYWITAHAVPTRVISRIDQRLRQCSSGLIILRLVPAAGADKPDFNRLLGYLIQKETFATVSHAGINDVEDVYLIPSSKMTDYPEFLSGLNRDLLPPAKAEDVLFMIIIFNVSLPQQTKAQDVWDARMKAIQQPDADSFISMRDDLIQYRKMIMSRSERDLQTIKGMPCPERFASPELRAYGQHILRLSYHRGHGGSRPILKGVLAPGWVFVLGRVLHSGHCYGLYVVDIQQEDQPLWLIRFPSRSKPFDCITLIGKKSPVPLREWAQILPATLLTPTDYWACHDTSWLRVTRKKFP